LVSVTHGHCDDGKCDAHTGQCDDHVIVTAMITPVNQCEYDHFDSLLMVGVMITVGHMVNVITWSVCQ
jgi:hypothetical protein